MDDRTQRIVDECKRQEESCLYTATAIFEWLKAMRFWRIVFVVTPIILGSIATSQLIAGEEWKWLVGLCALLAGVVPAVYKALDFDVSLSTLAVQAHQYKTLQDRFRQCANITAHGDFAALRCEFDELMNRMDTAREGSLTPPERYFRQAQKKIGQGHYDFTADRKG